MYDVEALRMGKVFTRESRAVYAMVALLQPINCWEDQQPCRVVTSIGVVSMSGKAKAPNLQIGW